MIPSYTLTGNGRHILQTFSIVVLFPTLTSSCWAITRLPSMSHSHVSFCVKVVKAKCNLCLSLVLYIRNKKQFPY